MTMFIGIDPSGAIASISDEPNRFEDGACDLLKLSVATPLDIAAYLGILAAGAKVAESRIYCVIEKVASSPQMGVKSAFTFGRSLGVLEGCLAASGIPYAFVTPQKWQKAMCCLSKGDKNVTKAAAQRLYPNERITHATADALLLATYCRRHASELF